MVIKMVTIWRVASQNVFFLRLLLATFAPYFFAFVIGSFHDHGRYICMSVVREKSLEQIHNKNQPFPFTLFMTDIV